MAIWDEPGVKPETIRLHAVITRMLEEVGRHATGAISRELMWAYLERGILTVARMHEAEHLWPDKEKT